MKSSGNKSEGKKRKRDGSKEPVSESPKKAKVHAQRKFAQGASYSSPGITQIKDKVRPPALAPTSRPMLTTKCPNTEDFLTFLCFRRTSILPAKLDFFKDAIGSEQEESTAPAKKSSFLPSNKNNSDNSGKQNKKGDKRDEGKKSQSHTVQALRKKYQEQRLAKQRGTNVTKLARKVKGKNMVFNLRTRSSAMSESNLVKKSNVVDSKKSESTSLRSGFRRIQTTNLKAKRKVNVKGLRSGLRSGGVVDKVLAKGVGSTKPVNSSVKKSEKGKKKPKAATTETKIKESKPKKAEGFSDFSSDDNEPLLKVNKLKENQSRTSPFKSGRKKLAKTSGFGSRETSKSFVKTRSQVNEAEPANLTSRPTRKTKEAAAIYMEMITKKLVSPEKNGDDDVSSVDSFPELPNAKRNEQRETEIRAKALAYRKGEEKPTVEDKNLKEFKKSVKNHELTPKSDVKSPKANPKKDNKQEDLPITRSVRRSLKEEPLKGKRESGIEDKKEILSIQSSRPSTRSRHNEESEESSKREEPKVSSVKTFKTEHFSKSEDNLNEKTLQGNKKSKAIKTTKSTNSSPKAVVEKTESCVLEVINSETESKSKTTRKSTKKIEEKSGEKTEDKEKQETQRQVRPTKNRDKFPDLKIKEKVKESKKGKEKKEGKNKPDKEDKKLRDQTSPVTPRPTRKCSTADKIWIDIDEFTSDEDEFAEVVPTSKTRKSAKGVNDKGKLEPQGKLKESISVREKKSKSEQNLDSENDSKGEKEKIKTREVTVEIRAKVEKIPTQNSPISVKVEPSPKSTATKSEDNKPVDKKSNEKRENESVSIKETKTVVSKKVKELSEPKAGAANSEGKRKSVDLTPVEASKTSSDDKDLSRSSVSIKAAREARNIPHTRGESERVTEPQTDKKVGKAKKFREEESHNVENEGTLTKDKEKNSKSEKSRSSARKNVVEKRDLDAGEEESDSGRRRRPVRQCSTREKRWIETDSDSFSFYESSDDEDNLPIFDLSGDKTKSSLPVTGTKETNDKQGPVSEKKFEVVKKPEEVRSDNFSESDEEPLKKKALVFELDALKIPESAPEDAGKSASTKTHRELPALHPLKRNSGESCPKGKDAGQRAPGPDPVKPVPLPVSPAAVSVPQESRTSFGQVFERRLDTSIPRPPLSENVETPVPGKNLAADQSESSASAAPNRMEMIFHPIKREGPSEVKSSPYTDDVKVTFAKVPCRPPSIQQEAGQISHGPYSFTISTANFPPPGEPISTHGLDLLSEVALPTTPKEKINSQTERIEKWLKDSLAADHKKRFPAYEDSAYKSGNREGEACRAVPDKPEPSYYYGKSVPTPAKAGLSSHFELQKFGYYELLESQKLLKRNLFCAEGKQEANKVEHQTPPVKKPLTSVQDLLKLQKERKESSKSVTDNSPHLKNCKCNNCIVKKGWFKNKPVPKTHHQKSPLDDSEESAKPFESLTKAFTKISPEEKSTKVSVSVAPMVVLSPSVSVDVMSSAAIPSPCKDKGDKRGIFPQRKLSFFERMKERERKEAAVKPSPNAFSPNNESSVYAFEPEPEQVQGVSAPFRSKARESRTSSASRSDEDLLKICEEETSAVSPTGPSRPRKIEKPSPEKGPAKVSQSASIAVQVNLDSEVLAEVEPETETKVKPELQDNKSIEISTQTEVPEEDSDSPMFYIPLQQAKTADPSAPSDQQLIQGVALKLGTEGPMGPNQRVIMKAKLVTKPPDNASIKAVVMPQPKRLFDQKNNNPPVGTVQPTTRRPPDVLPEGDATEKSADADLPVPAKSSTPPPPTKGDSSEVQVGPEAIPETELKPSKAVRSSFTSTGKSTAKKKEKVTPGSKPEGPEERLPTSSVSCFKLKKGSKQKSSEVASSSGHAFSPSPSKLVEAPTFHPTEKDFQDPFEFFDRIRPAAEKFGLCRIVPPANFKPDCKVSDDMRFTAYNQYVHRMFHRWGPNIKEMMAIKKYLTTQSISLKQPPWIGGIEVDLPRLYQSVQNCGGLMKVMEKKKWNQVADMMKIPKAAQDRVTKLDDIYCKYLLPYDTLSHDERQKLFCEVEKDWAARQRAPAEAQGEEEAEEENYIEECEECVVKGRNMALNQFYRIARNTMSMWFRNPEPPPREVENEFWKHVRERNHHVCVHSGSIDSSGWGYGFPVAKNNSFSKHPWNLKVLTNNCGSVLRSLGPVMGVTVPTLHVGMVFAAFCWYRDPHGLPWIEYLHTGAPKIWYGISDDNSCVFKEALAKLLPRYMKNKTIWLPSDTAMIPPDLLVEQGVSLCHTVQEPGQFILVFPRAFTSSICTGYLVSESVYFAQPSWLTTAEQVFKDIQESCEPSMFSLEKLLFSIATDSRSSVEVLKQILPMIWHLRQKEIDGRKTLSNLGLKSSERLPSREFGSKKKKGRWAQEDDGDHECEICRKNLYVSLVINSHEEAVYCLPHAVDLLTQKRNHLKYCKLMYTFTQEEMNELVEKLEQRIESKSQKKMQSKSSAGGK